MLPKVQHAIHHVTVPSLQKKHRFRPFLVREEKILLIAKESDDPSDLLSAIKQVVNNCCLDDLDIDHLALFDLEYLFLKIRAFSVENISRLSFKDTEDEKIYNFDVDLDKIEVKFPEKTDKNVPIDKEMGIVMRYPPASLYDDREFQKLDSGYMFELILRCVDKIYEKGEVYETSDISRAELGEWLNTLDTRTYEKIKEFLMGAPSIRHVMEYKNSLGHDRRIELTSLQDFFSWR